MNTKRNAYLTFIVRWNQYLHSNRNYFYSKLFKNSGTFWTRIYWKNITCVADAKKNNAFKSCAMLMDQAHLCVVTRMLSNSNIVSAKRVSRDTKKSTFLVKRGGRKMVLRRISRSLLLHLSKKRKRNIVWRNVLAHDKQIISKKTVVVNRLFVVSLLRYTFGQAASASGCGFCLKYFAKFGHVVSLWRSTPSELKSACVTVPSGSPGRPILIE